jgi:hypothetical protein
MAIELHFIAITGSSDGRRIYKVTGRNFPACGWGEERQQGASPWCDNRAVTDPGILPSCTRGEKKRMGPCGIIQHPLDRFSLTKSMADLDARGRDAVDQLMTMIGDLQFCRHDIRGTCARYFCFIDTVWLSHLCISAHIDCGRLQTHLWGIEHEAATELDSTFDDAQMSFYFPKQLSV